MAQGDAAKVGYIGLGNMGGPMVDRLLEAGFEVSIWGRSPEKLAPYAERGARICASPREVAAAAPIVITCVIDTAAVREVALGEGGLAEGGDANSILVDMSTISPDATKEMAAELARRSGMRWVDAPVTGGTTGAAAGTLAIMAGGDAADVDAVRPVLAPLTRRVMHMGPTGSGQATKLINQIYVSCILAVTAEAVSLAENAGIDAARIPAALQGGRGDSTILQQLWGGMLARDFTLTSTVDSLVKDFDLVQRFARDNRSALPMTSLAAELNRMLVQHGHGSEDNTVVRKLYSRDPLP
ncbi:NAD(P)-dependent oxidoreductase [Acuticoccus kandeliae]|uniref:NAD(P)-dependent oxidoreductase n=1 Tax=Acuticoccus kandeliae TaxID=2073160 RepID=UPI000D3EAB76|nr:NAD(P)-dependent oxidoreductase [Acuticoccus kandeliae]